MQKKITIKLPWPPRGLSPNARLQRYAKAALFKKTKLAAYVHAKKALKEMEWDRADPVDRVSIGLFCQPPINRCRDEDNLIANCKAYFDGIAQALDVNDHLFHLLEQEWQPARAPGSLFVDVIWEEKPSA